MRSKSVRIDSGVCAGGRNVFVFSRRAARARLGRHARRLGADAPPGFRAFLDFLDEDFRAVPGFEDFPDSVEKRTKSLVPMS